VRIVVGLVLGHGQKEVLDPGEAFFGRYGRVIFHRGGKCCFELITVLGGGGANCACVW
jgi:hypothetical protein